MRLALRKVAKFYGGRLVLKEVSLELASGQVMLLAGPNGAGKSTLLKIMAGLSRPSLGSVELNLGSHSRLGYLGHQTFIYPELTALENLLFWNRLYGLSCESGPLLDALERVELAPFANEKAGGFSRGMAQRLNLARVWLLAPPLLLLDEPATGLDTRSREMLDREVSAARARGAAIVWISHALHEDLPKADLLAVLGKSILQYFGPAADYQVEAHRTAIC